MRAAIYVRISKDFTGEGLGVTRQLEDCTAHAASLGWEVVDVYSDNDISATSGKRRPAYERMLADMDAGTVEAVIAWHADRLYRKVADLGQLVDVCKTNDVQISTVKGGNIDLTTPTGRLVAGLLAQVATYEGEAKADRWKRSWRQGREAGDFARTGTRLFGYTRDGKVIEAERELVREAMAEVLTGSSLLSIARDWQAAGVKSARGTIYTSAGIKRLLDNPVIAGYSTLNGEIIGDGNWEPLVPRDDWAALKAMLQGRSRAPMVRVALLGGLVHCGKCGVRMVTGNYGRRKGDRIQRNYRCTDRPGWNGCGGVSVRAENTEEIVEAFAKARLLTPAFRQRVEHLRAQPGDEAQEITELELRVRELEAQLDQPGTPVATILRAIDRTRERQEKLLATLGVARTPALPTTDDDWPTDLRRRRALVDIVVDRVDIGPAERGRNVFDPARVTVVPKTG